MDIKNFFKITRAKIVVLLILFLLLILVSPCTNWAGGKNPKDQYQTLTICSPFTSLSNPDYMVVDLGWPKVWGIFDLYKSGGEINYFKYLIIPFNLIISYLLSCVILLVYKTLRKK